MALRGEEPVVSEEMESVAAEKVDVVEKEVADVVAVVVKAAAKAEGTEAAGMA